MDTTNNPEFSLEALRNGDRAEFARLVDAYSGRIYRLARRMLNHPQDAEDVLQNTFLNALLHLPSFEGRSSLSTWLYRIATNEALMLMRKKRPEVSLGDQVENPDDEDLTPTWIVDWSALPESELLSEETSAHLNRAIRALPETLRTVFILRDIEGLSIAETSQALGLTETNVKTRLLRARLRIREELSIYFSERMPKEEK